jgi:hypothetical protein
MDMVSKKVKFCVLLMLGILFLTNPVFAEINTIRSGDTVFIGEQALDISLAMEGDTQIGWWASAASITSSSPTGLISISSPASFSITPNIFGSQIGVWYHLNPSGKANGTAFIVTDPQLDLLIEDTTVDVDVTDKWVPTGDELRFRINTNLVPISGRSGQSWTPITIKVQSPDGASFSALISNSGVTTSIVDYHVTTTPQYTDPIWGTGNRATYPPGMYTIWAECNVNSMKDNYGVEGKTISRKVSLLNQGQNPLITGNVPTTSITYPTITPTKIVTTLSTPKPTPTQSTSFSTLTAPPVSSAAPAATDTTVSLSPSLTKTKSAGFEAILVGFALVVVLAFCTKKE